MAGLWSGLLLRIAKRWIAGETREDAFARAAESNTHDVRGIINFLGEDLTVAEEAHAATTEYVEMLKGLHERRIKGGISVKPTQLGLSIDRQLFRDNLAKIVQIAKGFGIFVWMDMESSTYTTDTIESFLESRKKFDNVGLAIQAYLKRSEEDVVPILKAEGAIRLCKGAYNENPEIAYKDKKRIDTNFSKLMRMMFEYGRGFAIATHDEKLIEEASRLSNVHHADFEYEMLMGIRDKKKLELVQRGYRVSEYIPFGKSWWAYSIRRIREHKSNIFLLARSLLSG